jgi:hypothetical protein
LVLVVFVNHAACRWLRVLRPGFRHCFVVVRDGSVWLACDPLKDRIELSVLPVPEPFDLPGFYAARGHRVLGGATRPDLPRRGFAIAPLTCVSVAKRLLGVRAPCVLTPWQLYRRLEADGFRRLDPRRSAAQPVAATAARALSALDRRPK